jgi:DNA-binding PadR family transcriptional regulator
MPELRRRSDSRANPDSRAIVPLIGIALIVTMPTSPIDQLPLTVPVFQILLALLDAPLHGYALISDIDARTRGEVRLTASTLYGAIARMLEAGLIAEVDAASGDRRRSYRITRPGRALLQAEAERLARAAGFARDKRLIGPARERS